jgi:UDP-N-acetylmuramate dehydrogenase
MISLNHNLKKLNSFHFSINAARFAQPKTEEELQNLLASGITRDYKTLVLGGGSNLLFTGDFDGLIIHPVLKGIEITNMNDYEVTATASAGVEWDDFVSWAVSKGFGGIENLSLIPGHTGAVAIQNIGAYGVEAAEIIERVYCIDLETGRKESFSSDECRFAYRDSIFKGQVKGKYIVTAISFRLTLKHNFNTQYGALKDEAERLGAINLKNIREAVINIRRAKLPDPDIIGNAGSFFKNPVVHSSFAADLKTNFPEAPCYDAGSGLVKIAAGWLIEKCGWKGFRRGDAGVYDKQALVLVNHGMATGADIASLGEEIASSVFNRFSIRLDREVEVI